ncbi:MAG: hypothetical protein ACOX6H_03650 [Christensenellales bacterium]|jgi:hypothetical protein
MNNPDLKKIKEEYGERFAPFCRDSFPTILEEEGLLYNIISSKFAPSKMLYEDLGASVNINSFRFFIYDLYNAIKVKEKPADQTPYKSPFELIKEAGYTLYKCETQEDIDSFKKYWKPEEELCTFRDANRINTHSVFFAVKDGAENLVREDFKNPERQDEYGTSVISIQFESRIASTLSIKNRYNHTVKNPDATFSNNLDEIVPGLRYSFVREYSMQESKTLDFFIHNNYRTVDSKAYRALDTKSLFSFCENNILISNRDVVTKFDPATRILTDGYLIKFDSKEIEEIIVDAYQKKDSFTDYFKNNIEKIEVRKERDEKVLNITPKDGGEIVRITLDKYNRFIKYSNPNLTKIEDNFMCCNHLDSNAKHLVELDLPNVKSVGDNFCAASTHLVKVNMPELVEAGHNFMASSQTIQKVDFPNLKTVKNNFLADNKVLNELNLPNLKHCGSFFLSQNEDLEMLSLPNLETAESFFLQSNQKLSIVELPNLQIAEINFISNNSKIERFYAPALKSVGNNFLELNQGLKFINFPNLEQVGDRFIARNPDILKVNLPLLKTHGDNFLQAYKNAQNNIVNDLGMSQEL